MTTVMPEPKIAPPREVPRRRAIWKFPLRVEDFQMIEAPEDFEPLCVQAQGGVGQLWALVDPATPRLSHGIVTVGTGHDFPEGVGRYLGTYQIMDGGLVFHVFLA